MADEALELEPLTPFPGRRMEQAIAAVRAAIDDGRMKPGVKYSVYQLAEGLGISRTPVRDALLRLEEVGLIKFEARQGFRILLPQPKEIAEIFAVRLALELPAVRKAATASDPALSDALLRRQRLMRDAAAIGNEHEFAHHDLGLHDLILDAADNTRARAIVKTLRETTRLLGANTADKTRTLTDIDDEHTPVIDAIIAGQPDEAEAAMRRHLENTGRLLVAQALRTEASDPSVDEIWSAVV
ncbi:GntR family transcriptional regulator [Rhodococcus pseudokoreensis]|uniref:GntR family transcriptional regulator n=1 Tax=Rhodococcus pseudokoreensis TaxID=2811421 RepID=A0A974WBQ6_9NOCA|nr:GntR family transcriptional regulator [Rhodococcus pseudokoreensis]QSE94804.1 GntR family transcriptional regulator [Rhodococcus pseudokoreensis]